MKKRLVMCLFCAAVMLWVMGVGGGSGQASAGKRLVMYIADWSFSSDIAPEDAAHITHINYAFALIKDGRVDTSTLGKLKRLEKNLSAYPHIKLNLSIGGWGAGGFSEAVATPEGREILAQSGIEAVKALSLDGLDWDWEYPGSGMAGIAYSKNDNANMTAFLLLMRQKLDALERETGKRYEQSIAVGAGQARTRDYIWKDALPALDTVNIMTYDMATSGRACHHANLANSPNASYSVKQAVLAFAVAGVPREKLMIGAAYYFYVYEGAEGLGGAYSGRRQSVGYGQFAARLGTEFERIWDERAKAAAYYNGKTLLSGDDAESLKHKGEYVVNEGLAGVIVWEYTHDSTHTLTQALSEGLGN